MGGNKKGRVWAVLGQPVRGQPEEKRGVQRLPPLSVPPEPPRLQGLHCSMQKGSYSPSINVLSLFLLLWPLAGTEDAFAALLSRGEAAGKGDAALGEQWLFPDWLWLWHQRHLKVTWAAAERLLCTGSSQSQGLQMLSPPSPFLVCAEGGGNTGSPQRGERSTGISAGVDTAPVSVTETSLLGKA